MVRWDWRRFEALTLDELYNVLAAREAVFVVEQACPYPEIDGRDRDAWHLLGWADGSADEPRLVAYLRLLPPGGRFREPSIGRVLTDASMRGRQLGRALMVEGLRWLDIQYPRSAARLSAQAHLEAFYASFGFVVASEPYDEDGIMHIDMLRPAPA